MHLGFYYHIPLHSSSKGLSIPAYLGVFLDSLAVEVELLTLFMHEANYLETTQCDYVLGANNINYISLGFKTPAWGRFLWPSRTLELIKNEVGKCHVLLVRGPSPLAPAFYAHFQHITKVVFLIVGDYLDGIKYIKQPLFRKLAIRILTKRNDRQLRNAIGNTLTLVNSNDLYDKYKSISPYLKVVRTTTISGKDFYYRTDTCVSKMIYQFLKYSQFRTIGRVTWDLMN